MKKWRQLFNSPAVPPEWPFFYFFHLLARNKDKNKEEREEERQERPGEERQGRQEEERQEGPGEERQEHKLIRDLDR